jgi:flavin reductase (DIM6/NTAB) family NADH-FMN oxidoreductase RutF
MYFNHKERDMEKRGYLTNADEVMETIIKGAFLTVKADDKINTMTIGWATIGFVWKRKVFMVAVRDSRYTFQLMEKADNFTVTVPTDKTYKDAVMFCGTKSGRDYDKFEQCNLQQRQAIHVDSPVIDIPGIHYECKIIYKSAMDSALLDNELEGLYPAKDYHTLYFGEILACYESQ